MYSQLQTIYVQLFGNKTHFNPDNTRYYVCSGDDRSSKSYVPSAPEDGPLTMCECIELKAGKHTFIFLPACMAL
jgi:hypothetical protein